MRELQHPDPPVDAKAEAVRTFLHMRGWHRLDTTAVKGEQFTWWRKAGREFPQHFALWLEQSGAVRLLQ